MRRRDFLTCFCAFAAASVSAEEAPLVFAAASLKTVLDEIAEDLPMRLAYGGSGLLARQILQGAPADVFLSANSEWMDAVEQAGRISKAERRDLLKNQLVIIGRVGATPLSEPPKDGRCATGFVNAVPAGQYAKRALTVMDLWDDMRKRIVETDNVRAALALVSRGELPYGIVYHTDALADPGVSIVYTFAQDVTGPITYPIALMDTAPPSARAVFEALQKPAASHKFKAHGFGVF